MPKAILIWFLINYILAAIIFFAIHRPWLCLYFAGAAILTIAVLGGMG